MKIIIKLIEATPNTLWTSGEAKNASAPGMPTIGDAVTRLNDGTKFYSASGLITYRFLIVGDGSLKMQAFDSDSAAALAPAQSFDTSEVNGGLSYVFQVP